MGSLATAIEAHGNLDRAVPAFLREIVARVPEQPPTQAQIFLIGHDLEAVNGYTATVNAEWPELLAQRYHALTLAYDRTLRQFPRWRAFVRNASKHGARKTDATQLAKAVMSISQALADKAATEFVAQEIPRTMETLSSPIIATGEPRERTAHNVEQRIADVLESTNNILKRIAESGIELKMVPVPAKGAGIVKILRDGVVKEGSTRVSRWAVDFLSNRSLDAAQWLITNYPDMFG